MNLKIQILHRVTGTVLFEYESENNSIKKTLEEAVKRGIDLQGANLQGANLWGANLQGAKNLKLYWHLHHDILIENLTEPLKNRIYFIKTEKPKEEIETRLRLFKKVKAKNKDWPNTREGWEKLHKKECPNCPWNGTSIFSK